MHIAWRGRGAAAFWIVAFLAGLGTSHASPVAAGEDRFLSNVRQLTYEGRRAGEGYFSEDGRRLVFQSERQAGNPFYQIYALDFETGDAERVSPGVGKTTCAYFQPGTDAIVFASTHLDPEAGAKQAEEIALRESGKERRYSWDYDETYDLFVAGGAGTEPKRLTDTLGYDAEASYSPDGSLIVFCSTRPAYEGELTAEEQKRLEVDPAYFGEIYLMKADGSEVTRLTDWPGYDGGPFFSPDGERIIWRHFDESGAIADVYTMKLDGSGRRRLTDLASMSWAPYFHPSGRYAIFTSNKHGFGNFELFLVDAAGKKEPVRVTETDGFDGLAVFDPTGSRLAWTSGRTASGKSQLFLGDWDHRGALAAIDAAPGRLAPPAASVALTPAIAAGELRGLVEYLAGDALEGRMTGSKGTQLAATYIEDVFRRLGLEPAGGTDSYQQTFSFTSGVRVDSASSFAVTMGDERRTLALDHEFRPVAFSENGEVKGEVVFAGYGLKVPGELGEGYNSYVDLDVEGKIVLVLRAIPEDVEQDRRVTLNRYAGLRYKAFAAREAGAKGLIVTNGPRTQGLQPLVPLRSEVNAASSGIVIVSLHQDVAAQMLAAAGYSLDEVQAELDRENPHFEGRFALEGVTADIATHLETETKRDANVVAVLPPVGAAGSPDSTGGYILVGAHYDHIGYGETGSLARAGEEGQVHNGADDNASGTAVVLELAAALAEKWSSADGGGARRGVLFALWSGEEIGLVGSSAFAKDPSVPLESIAAYVNFDMVGRLRDNRLTLQGVGSSSVWRKLVEKRNVAAGFQLNLQDDPFLPTDVTAFYPKGVPVVHFFTGSHEEYNRPVDDPETLNYDGMERIAKFALGMVADLAEAEERPDYQELEDSRPQMGSRASLRAYLGTVPNYTEEGVKGVKLDAVRPGSPADRAGITGGDVIVELAGLQIGNIYDYTYAIEALRIGEEVSVAIVRDSERLELAIVPASRE